MTLDEFYPGFGKSIALKASPVQFCFNGDTKCQYPASWVLIGSGGSKEDDEIAADGKVVFPWEIWIGPGAGSRAWECYTVSAGAGFYDVTNGTKSRGHIWQFSSGSDIRW